MALFGFVWAIAAGSLTFVSSLTSSSHRSGGELYYQGPVYDLNNASVTIGAIWPLAGKEASVYGLSTGSVLAAFCQANLINEGLTDFTFKGKLNLVIQKYYNVNSTAQYFITGLLEPSLYNKSTNQQ